MNILTINGISKHFGHIVALNNISFTVPQGSVFGILGPNGSGKTTLLGIVTDVLSPTSGTYEFFDGSKPVNEIRKDMGVLLETPNFYPYLSAYQNLEIVSKIKNCDPSQINDVLKKLNLYIRRSSAYRTFSLGMKQRLAIASALLGNPSVLILDEPTNGLDPEGISEIRNLIKQLANEGKTIILASHLLDEVEKVCSHVAILKKGELLLAGDVTQAFSKDIETDGGFTTYVAKEEAMIEVCYDDLAKLRETLKTIDGVLKISESEGIVTIYHYKGELTPQQVNKHCFDNGIVLSRLTAKNKNLESKFLELTK